MAVVTLSDGVDTQEAVIYSAVYERYRALLVPDDVLVLTGKVQEDRRTGGLSFIVDVIKTLEQVRLASHGVAVVRLTQDASISEIFQWIEKSKSEDAGVPVRLEIVAHGKRGALDLRTIVRPTDHFIQILRTIPGVKTAYYEYSSHAQFVWHEGSLTRPESVLRR